jgi:hypothetical protein
VVVSLLAGYMGYYFNRSHLSVSQEAIKKDTGLTSDDLSIMLRCVCVCVCVCVCAGERGANNDGSQCRVRRVRAWQDDERHRGGLPRWPPALPRGPDWVGGDVRLLCAV